MFEQTLIAAAFGLLFAGNALAVDHGHFAGLAGWQKPGAAQTEATPETTPTVAFEDAFPTAAGALNVSASESDDVVLPVAGGVNQQGSYATQRSLLAKNVSVTRVPEPKDWLLILAGLGLVGVMVERTKRRAI
ncbi:MAG: hypothetical protein Q8K12_13890 [Thiobacillus sp.]|nr:hypothetical protein [Thiobacillus sp.]